MVRPSSNRDRRLARFRIGSYGDNARSPYAARLLSWPAIEHAFQRLSIGLGRRKRMDPTGFFSYEDIWLPGQFRATNPPRTLYRPCHCRGPEIFPDIARLDELVKSARMKLPSFWWCLRLSSTKVAQPRHGRGGGKGGMQLSLERGRGRPPA